MIERKLERQNRQDSYKRILLNTTIYRIVYNNCCSNMKKSCRLQSCIGTVQLRWVSSTVDLFIHLIGVAQVWFYMWYQTWVTPLRWIRKKKLVNSEYLYGLLHSSQKCFYSTYQGLIRTNATTIMCHHSILNTEANIQTVTMLLFKRLHYLLHLIYHPLHITVASSSSSHSDEPSA